MSKFIKFCFPILLLSNCCFCQVSTPILSINKSNDLSQSVVNRKRLFNYEDIFLLKRAYDVKISPDGKWIVYVMSTGSLMSDNKKASIWLINTETGVSKRFYDDEATDPLWSPDSRKIAFAANDKNGKTQLFFKELASGRIVQITNLQSTPQSPVWSPDGQTIAFTAFIEEKKPTIGKPVIKPQGADWVAAPKIYEGPHILSDGAGFLTPGHTHIFITTLNDTVTKQLTFGPYNDQAQPEWTRDNQYLLFTSKRGPDAALDIYGTSTLFKIDVLSGEIQEIKTAGFVNWALVSPDGSRILTHLRNKKVNEYFILNIDGSNKTAILTSFNFEMTDIHWAQDGRSLFLSYGEKGVTKLANTTFDGNLNILGTNLGDDSFSFTISNNGRIAYLNDSGLSPGDVTMLNGKTEKRLTKLNDALLNTINLGNYRQLQASSSGDKRTVGGWLLLPANYDSQKRYPMILKIHGGPHGYDSSVWSTDNQLYAAAGYVVLTVNYRGSTSFGKDFELPDYENYQKEAYADLMSAVDEAIRTGVANPNELFVMGGSAGGQLTAWIVGKTTRFRAAVAIKPVINLISMALTSDQYLGTGSLFEGKNLWDAPIEFWKYSPISLASNIKTPTMLMVGEEDKRTPPSEALQLYHALQIQKIPTAFVYVPGASHESINSKPSQQAANVSIVLGWFARYRSIE